MFYGSIKLKEVTIPKSVTNMGGSLFGNCKSLEKVIFLGDAPKVTEKEGDLGYATDNAKIYCKKGSTGWEDPVWEKYEFIEF